MNSCHERVRPPIPGREMGASRAMSRVPGTSRDSAPATSPWRWLPLAALAAALALFYAFDLQAYLSFERLAQHETEIRAFVVRHRVFAVLIFMLAYFAIVALSLPGAALMSVAGGFLLGWTFSAPAAVVAATCGAVVVFAAVKTSLGTFLAQRAGPAAGRLSRGFAKDAFNYLLFLRLMPAFPFFVVNVVAGLCNVRLATFVAATALGIIPGAIAFAYLGSGFGTVLDSQRQAHAACLAAHASSDCGFVFDPAMLVTRELLLAFAILGIMALLPVLYRRLGTSPPDP